MTASDASAKTVQRLNYAVGDLVDVITMPLTQDRLADISRKAVAVYAVTDRNLAKLCFDRPLLSSATSLYVPWRA